jgi:hypothetical protein
MPHLINVDVTGNALGQYCTKFSTKIHQDLRQELEFEKTVPFVSCDYAYQGKEISISDLMQAYQKAFTPKNNESFDGLLNTLQIGKVDIEFDWAELEKLFDKFACNFFEAGKNEDDWAFQRYIMSEVVPQKLTEELNLCSWGGVRVAPTAGTAGAFMGTFTGWKKQITDFVAAGAVTPVATGAFADATMVDQIRDWCKALPINYRYMKGTIHMSMTNAQRYADRYAVQFPTRKVTEEMHGEQYLIVDHYNKHIKGYKCMEGSNRIFITFDNLDSMIIGTRQGYSKYPNFRVHTYDRTVHVLAEFYRFFGFETLKHFFVNDQA